MHVCVRESKRGTEGVRQQSPFTSANVHFISSCQEFLLCPSFSIFFLSGRKKVFEESYGHKKGRKEGHQEMNSVEKI